MHVKVSRVEPWNLLQQASHITDYAAPIGKAMRMQMARLRRLLCAMPT